MLKDYQKGLTFCHKKKRSCIWVLKAEAFLNRHLGVWGTL